MSKLLMDDYPLVVSPKLAEKIGLNEAIILQQIHYWLEINAKAGNNYINGKHWTFNSYAKWKEQFPFWSEATIKRTIKNLEGLELIEVSNYNKLKFDKTKWYTIDYEALTILENSRMGQVDQRNRSEWLKELHNLRQPIPETNSETNKQETKIYITLPSDGYFLKLYKTTYKKHFNKQHPRVASEDIDNIISVVEWLEDYLDGGELAGLIKYHFDNLPKSNNGNILAFMKALPRYLEELHMDLSEEVRELVGC